MLLFFISINVDLTLTEMLPKWFDKDNLPYKDMWPDDKIWYPIMFQGKIFQGKFHFEGYDKILLYTINEVEAL